MIIRRTWPLAVLLFLVLGGCATAPDEAEVTEEEEAAEAAARAEQEAAEEEEEAARAVSADECPPDCDFARTAIEDPDGILAERTIYFEFDESKVQDRYMNIVRRHAAYLTQYPDIEVRLEGHTDERGSREYNIGLGERRADSVSQLLQAYGVASRLLETISFGEELPAVEGHNEEAWAKNRRVEIVYDSN